LRNLPAPSVLVVVGLLVGLIPGVPHGEIAPDVMVVGVLPPLLFAAAQEISLPQLRRLWQPVAALALGLVAVTAVAVALLAHGVEPSVSLAAAFVLGAVLSSTDPVAVTALARRLNLPVRTSTLVQSESLFNDATSLVLFQAAVGAVVAGDSDVGTAAVTFLRLGVGGVAVGAVLGWLAARGLQREQRGWVVLAVDVTIPYVAAVGAHFALVSPVTAVIVAGLMVSGLGRRGQPPARRRAVATYGAAVRLLENAVFAVIGYQLAVFMRDLPSSQRTTAITMTAVIVGALLVVRAAALGIAAVFVARRPGRKAASYRPWQAAAVVTWAGTRGVVPLAAALAIPATVDSGSAFPHRALLLVVATAVVVVTLVVQGTTLRPLVTRLGVVDNER
jgi:CPA1 family monovalent cation:H+ antiporter